MSKLVERVARAHFEARHGKGEWDSFIQALGRDNWEMREEMDAARAAILEVLDGIEEPSEGMRLAAMSAYCDKVSAVAAYKQDDSDFSKGLKSGLGMVSSAELDAAYQAMLAQLRKEVAND